MRTLLPPVVAAVLVVLTLGGLYHLQTEPGTFWARTTVTLYPPKGTSDQNLIQSTSGSLVQTAGIVANMVDPRPADVRPATGTVSIVEVGVKDGWAVYQPNYGTQFATNYLDSTVFVDVVAPTAGQVTARTSDLVTRIQEALTRIQDETSVPAADRITARPATAQAQVIYLQGARRRAEALVFLLGAGLALTLPRALRRALHLRARHL